VAFAATHPGWERPYGWAWALTLHEEAASWAAAPDAPHDVRRWAAVLQPLADHFLGAVGPWLPAATHPVRSGLHPSSAFGLLMAQPAARRAGVDARLVEAAERWFADDTDAPVRREPSGSDFLSPSLVEAVLMSVVLPAADVPVWPPRPSTRRPRRRTSAAATTWSSTGWPPTPCCTSTRRTEPSPGTPVRP
jgi:hypothetical protein